MRSFARPVLLNHVLASTIPDCISLKQEPQAAESGRRQALPAGCGEFWRLDRVSEAPQIDYIASEIVRDVDLQ